MSATVEVHLRKRYQCSACRRSSSSKQVMERHVADGCIKDPDTHACPTCVHNGVSEYSGYYCSLGLLDPPKVSRTVAPDGLDDVGDYERKTFIKHCPEWAPGTGWQL